MTLVSNYAYVKDCSAIDLERLKEMARDDLMEKAGLHMVPDTPYRLRLRESNYSFIDDDGSIKRAKLLLDIEPIPQYSIRFLTPEEIYLSDDKSLFQKLKNCLSYLFSGDGKTVCERIK